MQKLMNEGEVISSEKTLGELCMHELAGLLDDTTVTRQFAVAKGGAIYYFHIDFVGIRPPYTSEDINRDDEDSWLGLGKC